MKDKFKKIACLMVAVYACMVIIDFTLSLFNTGPIFALPVKSYWDGGTVEYYGLGYKVIKYRVIDGKNKTVFGLWNLEYNND